MLFERTQIFVRQQKRPLGLLFDDASLNRLTYSMSEFEQLPIHIRLLWLKRFIEEVDVPAVRGWFNNIIGVLEAFVKYRLADTGSWLSVVDAVILHAIQDGYQLYKMEIPDSLNPSAAHWALFFQALALEIPLPELFQLWSEAEVDGTEYGQMVAHSMGLQPTIFELFFLKVGDLYRLSLIHAGAIGRWGSLLGALLGSVYGLMVSLLAFENWQLRKKKMILYRQLGFVLGQLFVDPRYRYKGYSVVYWYSNYFWYACLLIGKRGR